MACAPIVSNETRSEVLTEVCGCLRQAPNPPTAAASNLDGRLLLALRSMGALLLHSPKSVDEVPQQAWAVIEDQATTRGGDDGAAARPCQGLCAALLALRERGRGAPGAGAAAV